jgi:thiamine-monophosphate kinase
MPRSPLTEDQLIARFFAPMAGEGSFGLTDDAAKITPPYGHDLVVTTDALVAGVHFFLEDAGAAVARKALRVNISDIVAKGALPLGFLLTLALPSDWDEAWLSDFAEGLRSDAEYYRAPLLGGDTTRTPGPLTISITAIGSVPAGRMVKRSGARVGHFVAVTGTIGDAALGLLLRRGNAALSELSDQHKRVLIDRYATPQPRIEIATAVQRLASAAMDVSDGLVGDLTKLLKASVVTAKIDLDAVLTTEAARAAFTIDPKLRDLAFTGGDDYEIVMTLPPDNLHDMQRAAGEVGISVSRIGTVTKGTAEPAFFDRSGPVRFAKPSFQHF